jgi:hypothetical protein
LVPCIKAVEEDILPMCREVAVREMSRYIQGDTALTCCNANNQFKALKSLYGSSVGI